MTAGPALASGADPSPDRCRHGIHLASRCGSCERSNAIADPRADWAGHAIGGPSLDRGVYGFESIEDARPRPTPKPTRPRQGPGQTVEATRPRPAPRSITEHRERKAAAVAGVLDALGVTVIGPAKIVVVDPADPMRSAREIAQIVAPPGEVR